MQTGSLPSDRSLQSVHAYHAPYAYYNVLCAFPVSCGVELVNLSVGVTGFGIALVGCSLVPIAAITCIGWLACYM